MLTFKSYITESKAADQYEKDVADYMASLGVPASRPKVSAKYADIAIDTQYRGKKRVWLEVKMNHTDNLGNERVFYNGKSWDGGRDKKSGELSPLKTYIVNFLNKSDEAKSFISDLEKFSGIKDCKVPTTKGGLKDPKAVPLDVMKDFFKTRNRYIMNKSNVDLGKIVRKHYLEGKAEPAYYLQAGDDFYIFDKKQNPCNVPNDVPVFKGTGEFKMRVGTRSQFYEVQPEVKVKNMADSKYSVKPGTSKKNPFKSMKQ